MTGDRPPPHNLDAEKAVLSCLLQDPAYTLDSALSKLQESQCFYNSAHRAIFEIIREMRSTMDATKIDLITVSNALERQGKLEAIGGVEYLGGLMGVAPTAANLETYMEVVIDCWVLRRLIASCADITGKCFESDEDVPSLIDRVEQDILQITEMRTDSKVQSIRELIKPAISYLEKLSRNDDTATGVPSGYLDLDRLVTGFRPGDMIVLAARPSIGKTTFAMNVARNVAVESGMGVGVFSLEMGADQVAIRLLCSEARINARDLRDGRLTNAKWRSDLMPAADRLYTSPIYIDDTPQITSLELRQKARRMKQEYDIQLVVIDYLQLMRPAGMSNKNANREQEVAKMSSDIKSLAKELGIPIIILAQLNRQAEQTGARPKLSHLRESGAIEQDADMVFLLHRDRETDSGISREDILKNGVESELIVAKNRNGETGVVNLVFLPHYTRFENRSRVDDDDFDGGGNSNF